MRTLPRWIAKAMESIKSRLGSGLDMYCTAVLYVSHVLGYPTGVCTCLLSFFRAHSRGLLMGIIHTCNDVGMSEILI